MNKSLVTNLLSIIVFALGYAIPKYENILFSVGLFAFSGGVTNWLAIHMLFEKVPFLYGSGVIPSRFEDFKKGIRHLIIQEFFTHEHIERFFSEETYGLSIENLSSKIHFDSIFEGLVEAIQKSSLGSLLGMFGGKTALEPLREPVIAKLQEVITELLDSEANKEDGNSVTHILISKVEKIIDSRLNELTPQMVKKIIQDIIRHHLGWLVVWGGVFGGLIGLLSAILSAL